MSGPVREYATLLRGSRKRSTYARGLHQYLGNAQSSLNEVDSGLRFIARLYPDMREAKVAIQRVVCVAKPLSGLKKSLEKKLEDEQ